MRQGVSWGRRAGEGNRQQTSGFFCIFTNFPQHLPLSYLFLLTRSEKLKCILLVRLLMENVHYQPLIQKENKETEIKNSPSWTEAEKSQIPTAMKPGDEQKLTYFCDKKKKLRSGKLVGMCSYCGIFNWHQAVPHCGCSIFSTSLYKWISPIPSWTVH